MSPTIVLISGANRGLGRGLLERYLARPDHTVIAANRNVEHVTSKELFNLPKGSGSRVLLVKVDGNNDSDAVQAAKDLQDQGIDHLDVVIANAGAHFGIAKVSEVKIEDIQRHMEPNVYGTIRLYQAMLPLLLKSTNPKWITVGSGAGSLEYVTVSIPSKSNMLHGHTPVFQHCQLPGRLEKVPESYFLSREIAFRFGTPVPVASSSPLRMQQHCLTGANQPPVPNAGYASSKVAVHWLTRRMNGEEQPLTAFIIDPGFVQTEMGNAGARLFGMEQAPLALEESCDGMVKVFDAATKESHGGGMWSYEVAEVIRMARLNLDTSER